MTPTIVHRYTFPIREAVEALLGDAVGDCEAWRIRVEGDEVVVDVVAPVLPETPQDMRETMAAPSVEPSEDEVTSIDEGFVNAENQPSGAEKPSNPNGSGCDSQASNETAKSNAVEGAAGDRGKSREGPHKHMPDSDPDFPADEQSGETSPEPELKGGPLARRAAICCGERGFWTFLGVTSADDAKADVGRRCGVTTRKMLDHDERAAAVWEDIDGKYRLWLEGHDVELD